MQFLINVVALLHLCLVVISQVDSVAEKQVYNITCDPTLAPNCRSVTLETIAAEQKLRSEVYIKIATPQLIWNTSITFDNLFSLTIDGGKNSTSIICISDATTDTGITLSNIQPGVTRLRNLNLTFCGFKTKLDSGKDLQHVYSTALKIMHCHSVELDEMVIERSRGIGLILVAHRGEGFVARSTAFRENKMMEVNGFGRVMGGGGVYIVSVKNNSYSKSPLNTTFYFVDCIFHSNKANTTHYDYTFTDILGKIHDGYGRGGGMRVFICDHSNVSVFLSGCVFIKNHAFLGAGMSVKIYGENAEEIENVNVEIVDSTFEGNGCDADRRRIAGFGGGIHLTLHSELQAKVTSIAQSGYNITNVTFRNNCAEIGGGFYHYSSRQGFHMKRYCSNPENIVLLENCSFMGNNAHYGSAVMVASDIVTHLSTGHPVNITFFNCHFLCNDILLNAQPTQRTPGLGTVYISSYNVQFSGCAHFENNFGTALYVVNAELNFRYGSATFVNNTGLQGGAMALIGSSTLVLGSNVYDFYCNRASYKGGAIFVSLTDTLDFLDSNTCFIQCMDEHGGVIFSNWSANVTFKGNRAKDDTSGHSIYSTSLRPCQLMFHSNGSKTLLNTSQVFTRRGFTFADNGTHVATEAVNLNTTARSLLEIIPGEKYSLGITVTDELHHVTNASFWGTINDSDVKLDSSVSTLITDTITVRGRPTSGNLTLQLHMASPTQSFVNLSMKLLECPPGFVLDNITFKCVCNLDAHVGIFQCNVDTFESYLLPGYWAGFINIKLCRHDVSECELVTSVCPFCDVNTSDYKVILYDSTLEQLDRTVCGEFRTGVVCGKCQENYTVHFHSPGFRCKPLEPAGCKFGWIFYFLSEIVPVTGFFITVLILNISFTSGAVNGFILFGQLLVSFDLSARGVIGVIDTTLPSIGRARQAYQILYGMLNMDFFNAESLSFCLWRSASALDMLAVKYITILYSVLLIIMVIYILNMCARGGRWCGRCCRITTIRTSVIHGISTFLMIAYSQCISVSLRLLLPVHIHSANRSFQPHKRVWLNGNIKYFSKEHLPYAIPAVTCLLTIGVLPPTVLLAYPLINKIVAILGIDEWNCIAIITSLSSNSSFKPFLDSFQGCFKDNFRFFAGVYFLYRWIVLLAQMNTIDFSTYYTYVGGILLSMLVLHTVCLPYVKRVHNIIDALLFGILIMINSLLSLNFQRITSPESSYRPTVRPAIMQVVLSFLPVATMAVCVIVRLCNFIIKRSGNHGKIATLSSKIRKVCKTGSTSDEDEDVHQRLLDEVN